METIENTSEIAEYRPVESGLHELRTELAGVQFDVDTTKGNKAARDARRRLVGLRTDIESKRKELKAPVLEQGKLIDSEAKRIAAEIVELETPIDEQIKAQEKIVAEERARKEAAEAERVDGIRAHIQELFDVPLGAVHQGAAELRETIAELVAYKIDEPTFAEFVDKAREAKGGSLNKLRDMLETREKEEALAAEAEKQRVAAEAEAKAKREAEEREAEKQRKAEAKERAAEQARQDERQKELDAQAEQQRIEREKIEAEQAAERKRLDAERAKNEAEVKRIEAERQRVADEAEAKRKAEAEEAEAKRQAELNRAHADARALASLVMGCNDDGPTFEQWAEIRHSAGLAIKLGLANA